MAVLRRTARIVVGSAAVLGVVVVVLFVSGPSEPSYQGRKLGKWLGDLEWAKDDLAEETASEAVRQIGTNALPILLKMMQREDSGLKAALLRLIQAQRLIPVHVNDALRQHLRARLGIVALGPAARPIIPELQMLLLKGDTARFAAGALIAIGDEGLRAAVVAGLRSTNGSVRSQVAGELGNLGLVRFRTNVAPARLQTLRAQDGVVQTLGGAHAASDNFAGGEPDADLKFHRRGLVQLFTFGKEAESATGGVNGVCPGSVP